MNNTAIIHPNLVAGPKGPSVTINRGGKLRPIYLQQSVLDKACGPHCVYMAMMILKLVSRSKLLSMIHGDDENHILFDSWLMAQNYWLHGTPIRGLIRLFAPLKDQLELRITEGNSKAIHQQLLNEYNPKSLYIVNIVNWRAELDHWVLIVGKQNDSDGLVQWLVIDPYTAPLPNEICSGYLSTTSGRISSYNMNTGRVWQAQATAMLTINIQNDD